ESRELNRQVCPETAIGGPNPADGGGWDAKNAKK
ncbi:unnamed protein product, partial [marine sediment metagenome]